jgi:type VI protein secretion system component VasK
VGFVGLSTYRFYLALEWFGVAPLDSLWVRLIAPAVVLFVTCLWYAVWLRDARARLRPEPFGAAGPYPRDAEDGQESF